MHVGEREYAENIAAVWPSASRSSASVGFRVTWPINIPCHDAAGRFDWWAGPCKRYALSSLHSGGVNVLFCDGSVHFLSETIETVVGGNCGDQPGDLVHFCYPTNDFTYQKLFNLEDGRPVAVP
jgi:prepilin-type processing-associated H-X9-DG protein